MKNAIYFLFVLLLLSAPAAVQAQFGVSTNTDGTLTITNYTGAGGSVVIPATIGSNAVTAIGYEAFEQISNLTSVTVPSGVVTIDEYAFYDCTNLTSVTLPNTLLTLGAGAFEDCERLPGIILPSSLTGIDYETFYYCTNLTNITFPSSITSIGYEAFYDCYNLQSVVIPSTVTYIGYYAFYDCGMTNLIVGDNANLPNGGCAVDYEAFDYCYNLTNCVIGSSVTSIGYGAFYECEVMQNLIIGTNLTRPSDKLPNGPCAIGYEAFEYCYDLTNCVIGNNVSSIGEYAFYESFYYGSNKASLTIGNNIIPSSGPCAIDYSAFEECYGLANCVIGNNVSSIGYEAFYESFYYSSNNCSLTIGNSMPASGGCAIGYEAFEYCYGLHNLTLGPNVTSIGYDAFYYCTNWMTAIINITGPIQDYAFEYCYGMTNCVIGTNVTSIGYEAFYECFDAVPTNSTLTVGGGAIQYEAFEDCYYLQNLVLGPNVTSIGYEAFEDCESITSLGIPDNVTSIGYEAFEDCYDLTNVVLGKGITGIPAYAFDDCYALRNVTFGPNFGNIDYYGFEYCTNLVGLFFQGNAPGVDQYAFYNDTNASLTAYYYPGASGWRSTLVGIPTMELLANSLQVTLGPTPARAAGAQWQLDGGPGESSALTTLDNLATGSHTVAFTSIAGWNTPSNQTFTITNGASYSIIGLYTSTNPPSSGLALQTNGYGTISHSAWPKDLVIGKKYTVKAVPNAKNIFVFWAGGTNQPYAVLSASASYTFTMESNLVLTANFVTNSFDEVAGVYNGLFSATNGVTEQTAGMLQSLAVTGKGTYSGRLLINGGSLAIAGSFNPAGLATNVIPRSASQGGPLLVKMNLQPQSGSAPQITGTVTGTNGGVAWTANNLLADLATNALPSAEYTLLILPDTNNTPPAGSPGGDGYALITNSAGTAKHPTSANAKITGSLADGTTFNEAVPISQDGYIPVYANLYSGKGLLVGWISLATNNPGGYNLTWIHPATTKGLYKNGFTNILAPGQILLSEWNNPPTGLAALTNLSLLNTIGETNGVTNIAITTTAAGAIAGTGVSGTIDAKTGLLKVTIGSGADKIKGVGAILLNNTNSGGFFLTSTNAQAIEIAP